MDDQLDLFYQILGIVPTPQEDDELVAIFYGADGNINVALNHYYESEYCRKRERLMLAENICDEQEKNDREKNEKAERERVEAERQRRDAEEQQREHAIQRERERTREIQLQLERQRQVELERQRKIEQEKQKQEHKRQSELTRERQIKERERKINEEIQRIELERQKAEARRQVEEAARIADEAEVVRIDREERAKEEKEMEDAIQRDEDFARSLQEQFDDEDSDDEDQMPALFPARGRGRGTTRARRVATGGRVRGRGRANAAAAIQREPDANRDNEPVSRGRARARSPRVSRSPSFGRGRGRGAAVTAAKLFAEELSEDSLIDEVIEKGQSESNEGKERPTEERDGATEENEKQDEPTQVMDVEPPAKNAIRNEIESEIQDESESKSRIEMETEEEGTEEETPESVPIPPRKRITVPLNLPRVVSLRSTSPEKKSPPSLAKTSLFNRISAVATAPRMTPPPLPQAQATLALDESSELSELELPSFISHSLAEEIALFRKSENNSNSNNNNSNNSNNSNNNNSNNHAAVKKYLSNNNRFANRPKRGKLHAMNSSEEDSLSDVDLSFTNASDSEDTDESDDDEIEEIELPSPAPSQPASIGLNGSSDSVSHSTSSPTLKRTKSASDFWRDKELERAKPQPTFLRVRKERSMSAIDSGYVMTDTSPKRRKNGTAIAAIEKATPSLKRERSEERIDTAPSLPGTEESFDANCPTIYSLACVNHNLVVTSKGLFSWGDNEDGILGVGDVKPRPNISAECRVAVPNAKQVACGLEHSVAVTTDGKVFCWGSNSYGQLGLGDYTARHKPTRLTKVTVDDSYDLDNSQQTEAPPFFVAVACGYYHTVALTNQGEVYCWGDNSDGQIGKLFVGDTTEQYRTEAPENQPAMQDVKPKVANPPPPNVIEISDDTDDELEIEIEEESSDHEPKGHLNINTPVKIPLLVPAPYNARSRVPAKVEQIGCSAHSSFGLTASQGIFGWGSNEYGQLANHNFKNEWKPGRIPAMRNGARSGFFQPDVLSAAFGDRHVLCLQQNGQLFVWGCNDHGQLGLGHNTNRAIVTRVAHTAFAPAVLVSVAAGFAYSMALASNGALFVWGLAEDGRLGNGCNHQDRISPVRLELCPMAHIFSGYNHTFAISTERFLYAWGKNTYGQLGIGDTRSRFKPRKLFKVDYKPDELTCPTKRKKLLFTPPSNNHHPLVRMNSNSKNNHRGNATNSISSK